jgi:hypothetical protein
VGEERAMTIKGDLKDMNLSSIITLNCNEGKRACLQIGQGNREASVFFDKGQIVHAVLGSEEGEEVVYELLTWDEGTFEIVPNVPPPKHTITTHWSGLLLDGMRRVDEDAANRDGSDNVMEFEGKEEILGDGRSPPKDVKEEDYIVVKEKEAFKMNVKKLNEAIEILKEDLGGALLMADIYGTADGQSIVGFKSNPKACALMGKLVQLTSDSLESSGFPPLGRYLLYDLVDGKMAIAIPLGEYQWGMLIDGTKAPLGLLLNVVIPKSIDAFEEAIAT